MGDPADKLLTISLVDYLALTGKKGRDFTAVSVEYSRHCVIGSSGVSQIESFQKSVRDEFLKKLPVNTVAVLSVRRIFRYPTELCTYAVLFASYHGTALVSRKRK